MTKIYTFNTVVLNDDALFDEYFRQASPYRRGKIEALRFRKDKNLSLGAAAAMDMGLGEYGLRERDMQYCKNQCGKPCFAEHPEIYFNISHSETMALAVFSDRPVGCDIEKIREANFKLAERFLCPEENRYILSEADPELAFWRVWTLKESFLKALGTGIGTPMNSFCIKLTEAGAEVIQTIDENEYSFTEYMKDGYRIAVCENFSKF